MGRVDVCCFVLPGLHSVTGLLIAPNRLSHSTEANSTRLWTTRVHVNIAGLTFPNGSGWPSPTCQPRHLSLDARSPVHLSPSDCLCIYFESIQFVRCVCEVRVIQTLQQVYCFDKKASLHRKEGRRNTSCFEE